MKLNPSAVLFWFFCTLVGFLVSPTFYGAAVGLTIGIGFSLVVGFLLAFFENK